MKGDGGSSCKGYRERKRRRGDSKCSTGIELISFNTCTSSNIRIIIYLINAVYSVQVGRCVLCVNASDCTWCVRVHSCVPVGGRVIARRHLCVCVCVCVCVRACAQKW